LRTGQRRQAQGADGGETGKGEAAAMSVHGGLLTGKKWNQQKRLIALYI
jgi:hypothetical protein